MTGTFSIPKPKFDLVIAPQTDPWHVKVSIAGLLGLQFLQQHALLFVVRDQLTLSREYTRFPFDLTLKISPCYDLEEALVALASNPFSGRKYFVETNPKTDL